MFWIVLFLVLWSILGFIVLAIITEKYPLFIDKIDNAKPQKKYFVIFLFGPVFNVVWIVICVCEIAVKKLKESSKSIFEKIDKWLDN